MAADISLLFGVLGEGSLSGDSGKLIQSQLTQIMAELNKSPLKVKVGLDTTSGGKQSWSSQLQQKLDQISASGKFSAQISTLKLSPGAVSDFKKQLTSIVSTLGLSAGAEINITPKGIDEATRQVEQVGNAASNAAKKATELASAASSVSAKLSGASQQTSKSREEIVAYSTQLNVLKTVLGGVESIYKSASFGNSMLTDPANIDKVTASVNNLKLHIEEASKISIGDIAGLERENELIKQEAKELVELVSVLRQVETAEQAVNTSSPMSTERIAQLASLKSAMDAISSTFNSAVFGKNMITDATSIQEITNKFVECTVRAKEALATSAEDTATLKNRVTLLQENARELQELVTLSRQLETPGVDYEVQFKALKATIASIDSLFNSAIAGKSKFENPAHIAEITSEYERFRTAAKEALDSSQTGNANDLKERVATLRTMASEFQTLVAAKRQFEQPGTEFDVQLQTLKATISSIDSLFNSAIAGKSKFENPAYITEVTTEYEKFKRVATEALNVSQTGNTDALKKNVVEVQNAAGEFQKLISLARQLEMPGADYAAKLREVQVVIRSIKSEFDAIMSGRRGIVSEQELQTASALYQQVEEIERRIKSVTDAKGLQNEIPALRSIRTQILDIDEAIKQAKARLDALVAQKDTIGNTLNKLSTTSTVGEERARIDEITAKYAQWAAKIEEVKAAKAAVPASDIAAIEAEGAAILSNIERLNEERLARENAANAAEDAAKRQAAAAKSEENYQEQKNAALRTGINLLSQMEKAERDWTAAQSGSSKGNYAGIQSDIATLKDFKRQLESNEITVEEFRKKLGELQASFSANSNAIKGAGENMRTLSARIGNLAQKFSAWLSVSQVIMLGVRSIRRMVSATIELDDAMTQLKIVTRDTADAYDEYLGKITQTATRIGSAVPDLIDSTTTFARLGYSLEESSALAEFTAMLQNVGDIDVADAQDALTAIVKAFGVSVDEVESIMDKLVITGNNFPISVSQIAEGMNNASSALAAAGNTFEQSVALLTAANTTIQNAAKSSTGLRTIAARLRSTKTELDDLGETMTEAEYGALVAALTKYNVALTDINGEFRSTYDIVADIAAIWDDLSTMEQAALANAIAGVRQQSVFFSMVEQFQEASGAMEDMANSAGTLQESYATFMESTTAHINQFKAAFQSLSQSTFTTDFLNNIIDFGTSVLGILESIMKVVGAIGGLNTVLYVTVGLIATIKAEAIVAWFLRIGKSIGRLGNDILGIAQLFRTGFAEAQAAGSSLFTSLGAGFKSVTGLATTAQLAVGAFVAILGIALIAYNSYQRSVEEARQRNIASANAARDLTDELSDLTNQYLELSEAVGTDADAKEDLISTQDELIDKLGLEKETIQELTEEYGNLSDAIKAATVSSLQEAERDLRGGLNEFEKDLLKAGKPSTLGGSLNNISSSLMNGMFKTSDSTRKEQIQGYNALKALENAGYISSGSYSSYTDGDSKYSQGFAMYLGSDEDLQTIEGIIEAYDRLGEMLDIVADKAGSDNFVYEALYDKYNSISDVLGDYRDSISALNKNLAEQYMLQGLIGREIPTTQEEYDAYRQSVLDAAKSSGEFLGTSSDIESAIDAILSKQVQFAEFQASSVAAVDETATAYKASLSDLSETITTLQSAYTLLETAQKEMASEDGLSASTIKSLADASEDYLDYLYEENGVIKLNTEAWKENADAKMLGEMADIQKEIDSLMEQNAVLQENIDLYNEKAYGTDNIAEMDSYFRKVNEATAELRENTAAIEANQSKLDLYNALYGNITGNLDAYSAALANFTNVANSVDTISNSFQTLADLQAEVANGFTMSLDKALEFAAVYPEILNNAEVSADGQIILNEDVVNSFLQGKKAELDAQIDAQIAQLEADKAVLEAKMEAAQAQLDLAKNVGEGEGQIAKELAEYRINAGNAVAQAMIDAGIDEATAFKLAAAAMAQNAEEFDRVAMEVCTDVNGNFNQAAYDLAQTMYNNLTNVKTDLASVATQAHETAKAIAGIADGSVSGSSALQGGSGGGTGSNGIQPNLTSGSFVGTEYQYTAKESGLDDFISQIELDISDYQNAIAQIDGQIATLQALKNMPLKSFRSDVSGSGSNSKSDTADEVEEYIAAIDDYREAIERLNRVRIKKAELELDLSNTDDLREQIRLQELLVNVYRDEQNAMHNLNDLRDKTIAEGADTLRQLGFNVEYNPDTNKFFIQNMEHLNELVADSKGAYDSLQEATNALREDTEDLIDTLESLNDANQENSEAWAGLRNSIHEAKIAIIDALKEIVSNASDSVDEIQNVFDVLKAAADEFAEDGFISVDAYQKIIELGPQYMQYLRDENGLLVINEESINRVIEAKVRQLAAEQALTYVERLRLALQEGSIENLNTLLYATTEATDATFGLAYAELALMHSLGDLNDEQYSAALHNIQAIENLANTAIASIGKTAGSSKEELENMKTGIDDILKYVMDMLKHRIQQQIDALEGLKDAYGDIISLRKEALEAAKEEAEYEDKVARKVKEIAKLQERINALSLDDSRDAQAQKIKLEEEMAELQRELADDQSDYAVDAQKDALDDMQEAYEREKDAEIAALEETISSYQKLYDMAIAYIESHWNTLYDELIAWNTEYGSVLNAEITTAWENCLAAAQRYGSYVAALNSIDNDISASTSGNQGWSNNTVVGTTGNNTTSTKEESIHSIIKEMYRNSQAWGTAGESQQAALNERNLLLSSMLAQYGIHTHRENDGAWYMDGSNQLLYDKYKQYIYHKGGIAGDNPTLKQNEIMAVLEKGEAVLDKKREEGLYRLVDFASKMTERSEKFAALFSSPDANRISVGAMGGFADAAGSVPSNISNSEAKVEIGPTYIYGANEDTVEQHREVTRKFTNEILSQLNIKR